LPLSVHCRSVPGQTTAASRPTGYRLKYAALGWCTVSPMPARKAASNTAVATRSDAPEASTPSLAASAGSVKPLAVVGAPTTLSKDQTAPGCTTEPITREVTRWVSAVRSVAAGIGIVALPMTACTFRASASAVVNAGGSGPC
jgi:hypothetical protein